MTPTPQENPKKAPPKLASIEKVKTFDRSLQVRGGIDPSKVERYREILRDNGEDGKPGHMDPIIVFHETEEGPRFIADGFHRLAAYEAEGLDKIPVIFREGNRTKALRFALGENGHHGAQMTNAEKRHAASMAVLDRELAKLTDLAIAKLIGCSPSLVGDCRRGETPAAKASKRAKKAPTSGPTPTPAGRQESESPAPREATARQRAQSDSRPTKTQVLRQIEDYLTSGVVDEEDVLKLMESPNGEWKWVSKVGGLANLTIIGKTGRKQVQCEVVVKEVTIDGFTLKYEGDGKVAIQGE